MASSLFPQQPRQVPSHIVEFKAGKCIREGSTNTVKPDSRKGLIYMDQSSDSLMHFYWKDRSNSNVEEDLIIFPDEAEFKKVSQCTTGRVYLLKFKSSSQRLFFWMQDKSTDHDEDLAKMVNLAINKPDEAISKSREQAAASQRQSEAEGGDDEDALSGFGGMDQDSLMQLLQSHGAFQSPAGVASASAAASAAGATAASSTHSRATEASTTTTGTGAVSAQPPNPAAPPALAAAVSGSNQVSSDQLSNLRNILQGISVPEDQPQTDLNLADVLTPTAIGPLLNDAEIRSALFPHLPESIAQTPEELRRVVQSPQFQQSLQSLSYALSSGQLGPLLAQLGLEGSSGASDVETFLRAIEEQARRRGGSGDGNAGDRMDTD